MSAVPSTRPWKSCRGRYGLASEHHRASITRLRWHCQPCPLTTNNLCCLVLSSERRFANALQRLFCTSANPNARASWQIRGSEGGGVCLVVVVVVVGWVSEERKEMGRGCQNSSSSPPQLLPLRLFLYSTLAAKSRKEIKAGQHERHP